VILRENAASERRHHEDAGDFAGGIFRMHRFSDLGPEMRNCGEHHSHIAALDANQRHRHFIQGAGYGSRIECKKADGVAMTVTRESLLERFQLLRDDELRRLVQSGDLIDLAREAVAEELRRRGIEVAKTATEPNTDSDDGLGSEDNASASSGGDLVLIARLFTPFEAHMLRSRLEAEGVLAVVADDQIVGANPFLTMAVGGVRVLVPELDAERAREIVSAIERGEYGLDERNAGE
jgi:hypothetical protein